MTKPSLVQPGAEIALEPVLDDIVALARSAWPAVSLATETFLAHLAEKLAHAPSTDAERLEYLEKLHTADLYLACACAAGDAQAVAALDSIFRHEARLALLRLHLAPDLADDIMQSLRIKILAAEGTRPKIAEYAGLGPLRAWIRAATVHAALDVLRRTPRGDNALAEMACGPTRSPDSELDGARLRTQFKAAFQQAFAQLTARQRNLLRLRYLEDLNIDKIALVYDIGRSSAARWLADARHRVFARTRHILIAKGGVSPSEWDDIFPLVESRLEVSLDRLLRSA